MGEFPMAPSRWRMRILFSQMIKGYWIGDADWTYLGACISEANSIPVSSHIYLHDALFRGMCLLKVSID
jgi:hypothetical protein